MSTRGTAPWLVSLASVAILLASASGAVRAQGFGDFGILNQQPARNAGALTALRSALQFGIRCVGRSVDDILLTVAEALAAGTVDLSTAIDGLEAMSDCVNAGPAAKWLREIPADRADKPMQYIRERAFRRHEIQDYGADDTLSKLAFEHRKAKDLTEKRNVAVIEYTLGGKPMQPIVRESSGNWWDAAGHAERRALAQLPKEEGVQVTRVYSERSPCEKCWQAMIGDDRRLEGVLFEYTMPHKITDAETNWLEHLQALYRRGT